jgi:hypothetical protein
MDTVYQLALITLFIGLTVGYTLSAFYNSKCANRAFKLRRRCRDKIVYATHRTDLFKDTITDTLSERTRLQDIKEKYENIDNILLYVLEGTELKD